MSQTERGAQEGDKEAGLEGGPSPGKTDKPRGEAVQPHHSTCSSHGTKGLGADDRGYGLWTG